MAVYCTTTNVRTFNPHRVYTTTSKPTINQMTSIIAWITADMDGRMSAVGLTVPITTSPATSTSKYLKYICALGSAGMIEEAAFMGPNKNESDHANSLMKRYEMLMEKIVNNPAIISGTGGYSFNSYELENSDKERATEPFDTTKDVW